MIASVGPSLSGSFGSDIGESVDGPICVDICRVPIEGAGRFGGEGNVPAPPEAGAAAEFSVACCGDGIFSLPDAGSSVARGGGSPAAEGSSLRLDSSMLISTGVDDGGSSAGLYNSCEGGMF